MLYSKTCAQSINVSLVWYGSHCGLRHDTLPAVNVSTYMTQGMTLYLIVFTGYLNDMNYELTAVAPYILDTDALPQKLPSPRLIPLRLDRKFVFDNTTIVTHSYQQVEMVSIVVIHRMNKIE